jgi:S1-C subfamily serine protease
MFRKFLTAGMVAAVVLLGSAGIASAEPVRATAMEKTVAKVQPSVVYLDVEWTGWVYDTVLDKYWNNGDPYVLEMSCTGFVIDPEGYIATAGHCVDPENIDDTFSAYGAQELIDLGLSRAFSYDWADRNFRVEGASDTAGGADYEVQAVWSTSSTEPLYDSSGELNGTPYTAQVVGMSATDEGDTALLKVDTSEPLPALPLATEEATVGSDVISVGYPASVGAVSDATLSNPSFKEGSISSIRTSGTYPIYETSAALSGGMSGGPSVNLNGEVVGINSFGISGEVESFEFIQSAATLEEVMTDAGVDVKVGEPGTSYRAGLTAYYAGEKNDAVEALTKATTTAPDLEMADEYLIKAQALPDPSSPIIPILIGGVVLVVLAGSLSFLVSRRRKKSKGASGGGYPLPLVPQADVLVPLARTGAYAAQALPSPPSQLTDAEVVRGVLREHDAEPARPLMPV